MYLWKKNGNTAGAGTAVLTDPAPQTGDVFIVTMSSSGLCVAPGITASDTLIATVHPSVIPGININSNPPHILCEGTPIRFIANINGGGTNPQYQWYRNGLLLPGVTDDRFIDPLPLRGDTVQAVLISSAACPTTPVTYSNKMGIDVAPVVMPAVVIYANPGTIIVTGQWITFNAGVTNGGNTPSYQWIKNGAWIPGATSASYTSNLLATGDIIRVQVNSSLLCAQPPIVSSNELRLQPATGISGTTGKQEGIRLFPNPNNGQFTISVKHRQHTRDEAMLEVVNMLGQTIYASAVKAGSGEWSATISLRDLSTGVYLLKLVTGDQTVTARFEVYQ